MGYVSLGKTKLIKGSCVCTIDKTVLKKDIMFYSFLQDCHCTVSMCG